MESDVFEIIQFAGRLLFVLLLLGTGFGHLTQTAAMAGYAESKGVPQAKLLVQISGLALVGGAGSILLGIWGDVGALGIAVLLLIIAVEMHQFWKSADPMEKQMEMVQFQKDVALAGAALFMWVYFHYNSVPWTITGPLLN